MDISSVERIFSVLFLFLTSETSLSLEDITTKVSSYAKEYEVKKKMWLRDRKLLEELGFEFQTIDDKYSLVSNTFFINPNFYKDVVDVISKNSFNDYINFAKTITNIFQFEQIQNLVFSFTYKNRKRVVLPKELHIIGSIWYLIGFENEIEKTFLLDQISDFNVEKNISSTQKFNTNITNEKFTVQITNNYEQTKFYLDNYSEKLVEKKDNIFEVEVNSNNTFWWLLAEIYNDVLLISPKIVFNLVGDEFNGKS